MTTFINTYSFMDLLKDYNYVPETDHSENEYISTIKSTFNRLADLVRTNDYDFMDLLHDKGYVPVEALVLPIPSNDNDFILRVAS